MARINVTKYRHIGMIAAAIAAAASWSVDAAAQNIPYGNACQAEFDSPDLHDDPVVWDTCRGFDREMDIMGTRIFYWNLTGLGARLLEEANDVANKVEDVDIVYVATHMGAGLVQGAEIDSKQWPEGSAFSKNIALGNEGRGLSVLALAGCTTTAWSARGWGDGITTPYYGVAEPLPTRWSRTFRAGLRMIVGNWDVFYMHKDHGKIFANLMRSGYTIEDAWEAADARTRPDNDTAVAASGRDKADCGKRLHDMKITTLSSFSKLTGNQVGYYCQSWWTNDSIGSS